MKLATDVTKAAKRLSAPQASAQQKSPTLTLYNDISDIYPLSSPVIFHKTLDVLLLFSCTYLVRAKPGFTRIIKVDALRSGGWTQVRKLLDQVSDGFT